MLEFVVFWISGAWYDVAVTLLLFERQYMPPLVLLRRAGRNLCLLLERAGVPGAKIFRQALHPYLALAELFFR